MAWLLPFISTQFNGAIWRLEIDSMSDTVFAEIRNSEEKRVSFGSVNLITGEINFNELTTEERWLTGIEAAYDGVLLLHNYQSDNSPVHKGIIAIDALNGNTRWSNYTYAFDHLSVNGPVVFNTQVQPKKLVLADIKTGVIKRNYEPATDTELIVPIALPQVLSISAYKETQLEIEPYGNSLHYLEFNNFRIVSLHSFMANRLKQHLYISNDHDIVFEEIMNTDIQKIQPEAFILYKNCLIYIKNKSELAVLNL
jgi:hypothetical protein